MAITIRSVQWRSQPKILGWAKNFWGGKVYDFRRITLLFGKTPLKAQNDYIFQKFAGDHGPFASPRGYAYGSVNVVLLRLKFTCFFSVLQPVRHAKC